MFIINLTYTSKLEKIDQLLEAHVKFLDSQYKSGHFLASGRKVPRTGGIILSDVSSKSALEKIIEEDPFKQNKLAAYEIIEFVPSKTRKELGFLLKS
ncbi:MAG: YciI family protein [Bacteroidota bacterium]